METEEIKQAPVETTKPKRRSIKQRLLDATYSKNGLAVLAFISFIESAFFPIPPDFFIVPMVAARPHTWKRIAIIVSIASVLGSFLGYIIGFYLFESVGQLIVDKYNLYDQMIEIGDLYNNNAFWSLLVAAFTPIPFKVFTLAAGVFKVNLIPFALAAIIGRTARYVLVPYLAAVGGSLSVRKYFKHLNRTTWITVGIVTIGVIVWLIIR